MERSKTSGMNIPLPIILKTKKALVNRGISMKKYRAHALTLLATSPLSIVHVNKTKTT